MTKLFILLIVYQLKHFFADYPLQTPYMLGKFKDKGWILPLAAHSGVHALFTFVIAMFYVNPYMAGALAAFDFAAHFTMDRVKASPKLLGRYEALSKLEYKQYIVEKNPSPIFTPERIKEKEKSNKYFWFSLGFDQMIHHITHYIIIFNLI